MNDNLVGMVNQHVAVGLVFLAEEDHIHSEVLLHLLLQFLLIRTDIPILFQIGSQLAVACFVLITFLEQGFDLCQGEFLLNPTALLDEDVPVFLEDFIPHGTHHGFELGEGRKGILLGCFEVLLRLLCSIGSKYLVNDRLRASAFMVVLYLASIGRYA